MKVAKSPGGLKSTVCLCSRENSRGTGGRRGGGGETLGEPPDRALRPGDAGFLGASSRLKF